MTKKNAEKETFEFLSVNKSNKGKSNYLDNEKFLDLLIKYKQSYNLAISKNEKPPVIPNEIAIKLMKIAKNLAYRYNFINYTFRSEMQADALENCIRYCHKFDENKYKNPFAYFTQICFFAFVRRIKQENKQHALKAHFVQQQGFSLSNIQDHDVDSDFKDEYVKYIQEMYDVDVSKFFGKEKLEKSKKNNRNLTNLVSSFS